MALKELLNKSRAEKAKAEKKKTIKNIGIAAAIGTAIGGLAGILLAPKSGRETRQEIAKKAEAAAETVKESLTELQAKGQEIKEALKARKGGETAPDELEETKTE